MLATKIIVLTIACLVMIWISGEFAEWWLDGHKLRNR